MLLFHGTDSSNVKSIFTENFNPDASPVDRMKASMYGKGVYFSNSFDLALGFSTSGLKTVIVSRVLMGKTEMNPIPNPFLIPNPIPNPIQNIIPNPIQNRIQTRMQTRKQTRIPNQIQNPIQNLIQNTIQNTIQNPIKNAIQAPIQYQSRSNPNPNQSHPIPNKSNSNPIPNKSNSNSVQSNNFNSESFGIIHVIKSSDQVG